MAGAARWEPEGEFDQGFAVAVSDAPGDGNSALVVLVGALGLAPFHTQGGKHSEDVGLAAGVVEVPVYRKGGEELRLGLAKALEIDQVLPEGISGVGFLIAIDTAEVGGTLHVPDPLRCLAAA